MATLALQPSLLDDEAFAAPARDDASVATPPARDEARAPGPSTVPVVPPSALTGGTTAPPASPARSATAASSSPAPASSPADAAAASGGRTLEDLLVAAWDGLSESHSATCLLCGGEVAPRYGAGSKPVVGRCRDCGTEIA